MILVDMNQVCISNLMVSLSTTSNQVDDGLIRHMVLNSLLLYRSKFGKEYGELVLCYDSKNYWRRKYFQYYKSNRKKDRERSSLDWTAIFDQINRIKEEIRTNMPYKVVEVDGAEADDVIAILCKDQGHRNIRLMNNMQPPQKVLILSADKDFMQLQKYQFVSQYNPIQKKFVVSDDPHQYVAEHILKGDRSDGIPNFLSDDDTFVNGKRQRPLGRGKIQTWSVLSPEEFCTEQTAKNYERNRVLIDFDCIPKQVEEDVLNKYETIQPPSRGAMFTYFAQNKLNELMNHITEF